MKSVENLIKNAEKHRQLVFDAHDYIWEHPKAVSGSGRPAPIWKHAMRRWDIP